ncbi:MAG TPA: nucleotide sugar dehydrogenase [Candidatus Nanoarchaeia archaeon]
MSDLEKLIKSRKAKIVLLGLGYVGLPVACLFAKAGFSVIGVNRGREKVDLVNNSISPIKGDEPGLDTLLKKVIKAKKLSATTDYSVCKEADVVLIAVETPVDPGTLTPKYDALKSALKSLGPNLQKGSLVIVESTIAPGTMKNLVVPILEEESGLKLNRDFYLGHCPERVMPGKLLKNLKNYHRVVGGFTPQTAQVMKEFYKTFVTGDLDLTDVTTAEVVKTTENYYRDTEIAFANQLALLCESVGVNVYEARRLVNKVEDRNVHLPGAGVGGHCLPKDSLLNVSPLRTKNNSDAFLAVKMADLTREVNDFMPIHVINLLLDALKEAGKKLQTSKVVLLGYSYLADSDDTRNSPSQIFIDKFNRRSKNIIIHDPYVAEHSEKSLEEALTDADAAVFMVAHKQYKNLNLDKLKNLMRTRVLIDGRNIFDKGKARAAGFIYKGVGNI